MQRPPGLDVGAIDRHRARSAELLGHSGGGQTVGQPLGVDHQAVDDVAGVQGGAQLVEQPVGPVVGLVGVVIDDAQPVPLLVGHGIYNPGYLHHVAPVVTGQGVELGGDQQASQADRAGPADFRVKQGGKDTDDTRAVNDPTGGLEVCM